MENKILFDENGNNSMKGNRISFSNLQKRMKICFLDEEKKFIVAEVVEVYVSDNDENKIIGCAVTSSDGTPYALYEEDGIILYSEKQVIETKPIIQQQETKIVTDQKKVMMLTKESNPTVPKNEIKNLFQGRTELEKGNAKFPDWDIVPPNQFINPRIKQK
jgi:hypothetical protein